MIKVPFDMAIAKEIAEGKRPGKIMTRDGFEVEILRFNIKNRYCIAGIVKLTDDEYVRQWTRDGKGDIRPNVTMQCDLELFTEGGEQ